MLDTIVFTILIIFASCLAKKSLCAICNVVITLLIFNNCLINLLPVLPILLPVKSKQAKLVLDFIAVVIALQPSKPKSL